MWFLALPSLHPHTFLENVFHTCRAWGATVGTGVGACGPLLCTLLTVQCLPWVAVKPNTPNFGHKCILHIIVWNLHQWTHFTQTWLHWGGTGQIILSGVFITGYTILHGGSLDLSSSSVAIRESVDSLCRDGAGPPIVCVHWKSVLTRERSCSKPFWTPSYPIPTFLYPMIPPR